MDPECPATECQCDKGQSTKQRESQWCATRVSENKSLERQLSMVTKLMDNCYMLGFAPAPSFLWSQTLCTLRKSFRCNYKPKFPMCTCMQKGHICTCVCVHRHAMCSRACVYVCVCACACMRACGWVRGCMLLTCFEL